MILFLDVISPIPKFVMIDNNKVIESLHILDNNYKNISDSIHEKFLVLQRKYDLLNLLDYLVVCTGPGSYTSLRVGISFIIGLSYSKKIPVYGITCTELLSKFIMAEEFYNTLIVICSINNQNFICLPYNHKNSQYKIQKINDNHSFDNIDLKLYSKCISNFDLTNHMYKKLFSTIEKLESINLEYKLYENFKKITDHKGVLHPIYISDNKLFD